MIGKVTVHIAGYRKPKQAGNTKKNENANKKNAKRSKGQADDKFASINMSHRSHMTLVAYLIERRYQIPNITILDCLDLSQAFPGTPTQITINDLCTHWYCTPSNVNRRLANLRRHGLIDWSMTGRGCLVIQRIGPSVTRTGPSDGVGITDFGELVDWIFQNRHAYAKTQLFDLLDMGRMWGEGLIGPKRVVQLQQLMVRWSATRRPVQTRLHRLRDAGLIAYKPGNNHHPGYRINRIGPPSP